jgi:DNA-binding protein Alba
MENTNVKPESNAGQQQVAANQNTNEQKREQQRPRVQREKGVIFIGKSPAVKYSEAAFPQFLVLKPNEKLRFEARGKNISTAVDALEILKRKLKSVGIAPTVVNMDSNTTIMKAKNREGRDVNIGVSGLVITLTK